jgi:hypothetical protein
MWQTFTENCALSPKWLSVLEVLVTHIAAPSLASICRNRVDARMVLLVTDATFVSGNLLDLKGMLREHKRVQTQSRRVKLTVRLSHCIMFLRAWLVHRS